MIALPSSAALLMPQLEAAVRPLGATGPDLGRYFLVCALLVLLTGGLLLALRKGLTATVRARAARRSLCVIDVLPLGGRQKVLVVRCYDRTFLLGAGDKELTPIAELDPAIGLEPRAAQAPARPDREAFARALEKLRDSLPAPRLGPQVGAPAGARAGHPSHAREVEPAAAPAGGRLAAPSATSEHLPGPLPERELPRPPGPTRPRLEGIVG